jgi:hypothetical protein
LNSGYRHYFKGHLLDLIEVVQPEYIDGFFMDIMFRVGCHCGHCMKKMKEKGMDTKSNEFLLDGSLVQMMKEAYFYMQPTEEPAKVFAIGSAVRTLRELTEECEDLRNLPAEKFRSQLLKK